MHASKYDLMAVVAMVSLVSMHSSSGARLTSSAAGDYQDESKEVKDARIEAFQAQNARHEALRRKLRGLTGRARRR